MEAQEIKNIDAIITKDDKKIHKEAIKRFQIILGAEQKDRERGVEETRFANVRGAQWEDYAKEQRSGKPKYEFNYVGKGIDILIGDQRQTEVGPKITPSGSGATDDIAKTYRGIIRNIQKVSKAQNAYDQACDETYCSRYGGWQIITKYAADDTFEQDIQIKPIDSAVTALYFDPTAVEYDKSDAMYAFKITYIHRDDYDAMFPDYPPSSWQIENYRVEQGYGSGCYEWYDHDNIAVAEYYRKVPVSKTIIQMSDGTVIDKEKFDKIGDEMALANIRPVRDRTVKTYKIEHYKLNGTMLISKKQVWPGKYIPLIPQYGKITKIGQHTHIKSIVTDAQDAQRGHNYAKSTKTETLALAPKDVVWMTPAQVKGHIGSIQNMNINNSPVQLFNVDKSLPGSPAQHRMGPPAVQQALIELVADSKNDIIGLTGVSPTQQQGVMGEDVDLRSGKAIREQNIRSDTGNYVYWDNHLKSRMHEITVLVDLIPRIYDTERQVRIIRKDGTEEMVFVNQTIKDTSTNKDVIVNDLTQGKYDVDITTGKQYATQRLEAADKMEALLEKMPRLEQIAADIIVQNYDIPGADELYERIRKPMIMDGTVKATEEELKEFGEDLKPKPPSEAEQLQLADLKSTIDLKNAQSAELMASAMNKTVSNEKTRADNNKSIIDAYNKLVETIRLKEEQDIPITPEDQQNLLAQERAVEDSQEDILRQPNADLTNQPQ